MARTVSRRTLAVASTGLLLGACGSRDSGRTAAPIRLLNVSYDPTREFYQDFNEAFVRHWAEEHQGGGTLRIEMSHGGSGSQARAVLDGLRADVVTLAVPYDIDKLATAGLLDQTWRALRPDQRASD